MRTRSLALCIAAAACTVGMGLSGATAPARAGGPADVLERQALRSVLAPASLMLAVTRAGERLVAAGERGIVLLSDDHGQSWRQASVPVGVTLTSVFFASRTQGWAVGHGGVILHSGDGGETWSKQLDGVRAAQLVLAAAQTAVADAGAAGAGAPTGERAARRLRDAERLVADGPDKPLLDVYFANEREGLVVGAYGLAFSTGDSGRHWHPVDDRLVNPEGRHLYRIRAVGSDLYVAGEQGALYHSRDGGRHFTGIKTLYPGSYFGMVTGPREDLLIFGMRGNLYRTQDAGLNWQQISSGRTAALTDGMRANDGAILIVDGDGGLMRSIDDGKTFRNIPTGFAGPINSIAQAADGSLVLAGLRGVARLPLDKIRTGVEP
ncbi:glycosyl hydrolase [Cupriavidus necator]|uniref:Glycosyl hydrolase n=1 Tax=Cupriavidus necator TaxID=106590 RepID=A0A1U9UZR1_CUPNE|nr:YCF48-related protein [Cupriavidus necator]AQV98194.1 glycosyl hydrolase [Cupriavidus necator]